jgi:cation:H+ antiporter
MEILLIVSSIILSIFLIAKGSDWLTDSLIPIARKLKTSQILVGLILVSAVLSLPEILVAVDAVLRGYQQLSLGVVFGSILVNIAFMTGLPAMIRPLKVTQTMTLRDGIFSIVAPILVLAISQGGTITRFHGFAMFLLFIPYLVNVYLLEKRSGKKRESQEKRDVAIELELIGLDFGNIKAGWISFLLGIAFLLGGTYLFSGQLIKIVETANIDALFLGMTLGALVPSIPNIAAAYKATKKGLTDIAVSETLGSNIFTLLVTIGITSMFSPIIVEHSWIVFDIPTVVGMSLLLFLFMATGKSISREEGAVLVACYLFIFLMKLAGVSS